MRLSTPRLVLREAVPEDATTLESYQRDPRYLEHYAETPDATAIVAAAISWQSATPRLNYQFIVELEREAIGCAGLRQAGHSPRHADVGIELDPRRWGAGYAGEVLRRLLRFARDDLGLAHVHARTAPGNRRAIRLMEALGFRMTGSDLQAADFVLALDDAETSRPGRS